MVWQIDAGNDRLKIEYKKYTKILNKVIPKDKMKVESEWIKKNQNNPKHLKEIIKPKLGRSGKKDDTIKQVYNNDIIIIKEPNRIADELNSYFCNIGRKTKW